jgi:hypothetical protein
MHGNLAQRLQCQDWYGTHILTVELDGGGVTAFASNAGTGGQIFLFSPFVNYLPNNRERSHSLCRIGAFDRGTPMKSSIRKPLCHYLIHAGMQSNSNWKSIDSHLIFWWKILWIIPNFCQLLKYHIFLPTRPGPPETETHCQETWRRDTANKRSLELCASIVIIF